MKPPSPLRIRLGASTLLLIAGATVAARAQNNPPSPSTLEVGYDDGGGMVWTAQPNGQPIALFSGQVRVRAALGTWCGVMMRTWVDDTTQPGSTAAQGFWNQYPWLRPPQPYDGAALFSVAQWQGQPSLRIDSGLVALNMTNAVFHPTLGIAHQDAVRWCFQPAVNPDATNPSMAHRIWNAQAPVWLSDPTGDGMGPAMAALWSAYCVNAGDQATNYAFEAFAIMGIYFQAPGAGADPEAFLKGTAYTEAKQLGIYVTLQAITAASGDPSAIPLANELTTPGLAGIEFFSPVSSITNPVTVQLMQGIPSSTGGGGTPDVRRLQRLHFRATGLCATTVAIIPVTGVPGATVQRPVTWNTTYFTPFAANVVIPQNATLGTQTIGLQNGLGQVNSSALHANILPVDPTPLGG